MGIVFPIYLASMPIPVYRFLTKVDMSSARYVFAAATRIGTFHTADINIRKLLQRNGTSLNAFFNLNMAGNSPCGLVPKFPGFTAMTKAWTDKISPEKISRLESADLYLSWANVVYLSISYYAKQMVSSGMIKKRWLSSSSSNI